MRLFVTAQLKKRLQNGCKLYRRIYAHTISHQIRTDKMKFFPYHGLAAPLNISRFPLYYLTDTIFFSSDKNQKRFDCSSES